MPLPEEINEKNEKSTWVEPEFHKLKAEETASGFGGFDEDSDTKTGS